MPDWDAQKYDDRAIVVLEHPLKVKYTEEQEQEIYADRADRVAIYHANGDLIMALYRNRLARQ